MAMATRPEDHHVAVIGAGPAGLAAIRCLLDEGFRVTAFEKRDAPGGVWSFTEDPSITSVTKATKVQLSKFLLPFSDLPMPDDLPTHISGTDLGEYYGQYARAHDLSKHIAYNATVRSVRRDHDAGKWRVSVQGELGARVFDKVVYAVGTETTAKHPTIQGLELFAGQVMHGQAYKRPEQFRNMKVIVLGQGNSGADCAVEIASQASKVYFARRRGSMVVPRVVAGKRFDSFISWKLSRIGHWVVDNLPSLNVLLMTSAMSTAMKKAWGDDLDPEFRLEARPEYASNINGTLINDDLVPALRSGRVVSKPGIRRVIGPWSVEMDDGSVIDNVNAIVACTGYYTPFEPLGDSIGYAFVKPRVPPQPDLFQNIFPLDYPDSLACLNYIVIYDNAATVREVAAMAVAQVFAGKSKLPSRAKMEAQVRRRQAWFAHKCLTDTMPQLEGQTPPYEFERFVHKTAGTGLYEYLGWTPKGIWFFLTQPRLYFTIAWGLKTPHMLRLFDTGKRKAWPGAKEAILHANHLSKEDLSTIKVARR